MEKEYLKSSEEILQELQTSHQGLTDQQAETRLAQYGENRLQEGRKTTMLERFVEELKDPMLIMLMAAAAVSAITNIISHEPLTEVFIIIAVVLLNAVLGVFQESKAEELRVLGIIHSGGAFFENRGSCLDRRIRTGQQDDRSSVSSGRGKGSRSW